MQKKYIVRLSEDERCELREVIKKLKGSSLVVQKSQSENISCRGEAKKPKLRALKPRKYVEDCLDCLQGRKSLFWEESFISKAFRSFLHH
jgi:hypothetical protein